MMGRTGLVLLLSPTPEAKEDTVRVCGGKIPGKVALAQGKAQGFLLALFRTSSTPSNWSSWL